LIARTSCSGDGTCCATGTSFSRFLLAARLARVHRLLSDPSLAHRSISDVALAAGFSDLSRLEQSRCQEACP